VRVSSGGSGVLVRTEEMTSVMARTEAAAGWRSSSRPSWVECRVRCAELGESAASWSWAATQPLVPVAVADAVSTASHQLPSVVSACALRKTSAMTETSSRWFR